MSDVIGSVQGASCPNSKPVHMGRPLQAEAYQKRFRLGHRQQRQVGSGPAGVQQRPARMHSPPA